MASLEININIASDCIERAIIPEIEVECSLNGKYRGKRVPQILATSRKKFWLRACNNKVSLSIS